MEEPSACAELRGRCGQPGRQGQLWAAAGQVGQKPAASRVWRAVRTRTERVMHRDDPAHLRATSGPG